MSHLLNQTRYLETSFGLISLPSPFFLFLSFHLPSFLFVRLCFLCLIGVSAELILTLSIVFWWNITALFSLWHGRDIARPLQCCGNVFLWRWNDIIVTLPCCWGDWSYGTLSVFFWRLILMICCQRWKTKSKRVLSFDGEWVGNRPNWYKGTLCQGRSQFVGCILHAVIAKWQAPVWLAVFFFAAFSKFSFASQK